MIRNAIAHAGMPSDRQTMAFNRTPHQMVQLLRGLRESVAERRNRLHHDLIERVGDGERAITLIGRVRDATCYRCASQEDADTLNIADDIGMYDSYTREVDLLQRMFEGQPVQDTPMEVPFSILRFAMNHEESAIYPAQRFFAGDDPGELGHLVRQPMPGGRGMGVYTEHGNHVYEQRVSVDGLLGEPG